MLGFGLGNGRPRVGEVSPSTQSTRLLRDGDRVGGLTGISLGRYEVAVNIVEAGRRYAIIPLLYW